MFPQRAVSKNQNANIFFVFQQLSRVQNDIRLLQKSERARVDSVKPLARQLKFVKKRVFLA